MDRNVGQELEFILFLQTVLLPGLSLHWSTVRAAAAAEDGAVRQFLTAESRAGRAGNTDWLGLTVFS